MAEIATYSLYGIGAYPGDVLVSDDRVRVVEQDSEHTLISLAYKPDPADRQRLCERYLAPANLKKDAGGFHLPIALGLLLGNGQVSFDRPGTFAIVGELALTGETRPMKRVLAMAVQASADKRAGLLAPSANAQEAAVVEGLNVYPIGSLAEAVGFLSGQVDMDPESVDLEEVFRQLSHIEEGFADVKGQDYAKHAPP